MQNYVTTTFPGFTQLILNEGLRIFSMLDGKMETYICTDIPAGRQAIGALELHTATYMRPQFNLAPYAPPSAMQNPWMYPTQQQNLLAPYAPNHNTQFERFCFVCSPESIPGVGPALKVYIGGQEGGAVFIPVTSMSETTEVTNSERKAYSSVYNGSAMDFYKATQTNGVEFMIDDSASGRFAVNSDAATSSGLQALHAIEYAIRLTDNHHAVSKARMPVDISTCRPKGAALVCELLEGHNNLKVYFEEHPTLSVTLNVRRIR